MLTHLLDTTAFSEDYGTPKGTCKPSSKKGVYEREYSKATVSVDCNTWTGTIKMSDGRVVNTEL